MNQGLHTLRTLGIGLTLALAASGSPRAASLIDDYPGHFGRVDYAIGTGWIVGPYQTLAECHAALQEQIVSDIARFGYGVVSIKPCSYISSTAEEARLTEGATLLVGSGDDDRDGGDKKKKIRHGSTK